MWRSALTAKPDVGICPLVVPNAIDALDADENRGSIGGVPVRHLNEPDKGNQGLLGINA